MIWLIYILAAVFLSHFIASMRKKNYLIVFSLLLVFLATPAQIETNFSDYAPSVFTFVFNILFEKDFSTRVLRPLLITISLTATFLFVFHSLKKRFFQSSDSLD